MTKLNTFLLIVALIAFKCKGQGTNDGVFGQNANLTNKVGRVQNAGGKLDDLWVPSNPNNIFKKSGVINVRYSGIYQENNFLIDGLPNQGPPSPSELYKTKEDYIQKAKDIQDNGQVPMLLMPLNDSYESPWSASNLSDGATQVALLVKAVNDKLYNDGYEPVTQWLYPNEPNLPTYAGGSHGFTGSDAAEKIHDYIKAFHDAVKPMWNTNCAAWGVTTSDLKLIGPDLAWFDNYGGVPYGNLINKLCASTTNYINTTCILPYIDVFSWHYYPFGDEAKEYDGVYNNGYFLYANRQNVIDVLKNKINRANTAIQDKSFSEELDFMVHPTTGLLSIYNTAKSRNVTLSLNEANICHKNDIVVGGNNNSFTGADGINGTGANSFIAGQFLSELMSICIQKGVALNFWSSIEGQNLDSYVTNVGYLNGNPNDTKYPPGSLPGGLGGKKSTYNHFKWIADNFKGTFYNASSITGTNIKAFASKDGPNVYVLILNQNNTSTGNYDFVVDLNNSLNTSTQSLIKFAILAASASYNSTQGSVTGKIQNQSSVLLKFVNGVLQERCDYKMSQISSSNDGITCQIVDPLTATLTSTPACGSANGTATVNVTGGAGNYTYSWSPAGGSGNNQATYTSLPANTYSVTVTDANGATTSGTVTVVSGSTTADVYIKDSDNDMGVEVNTVTGSTMWDSPDIWVRNTNDNSLIPDDPEYTTVAADAPYVYVRVRNRSCQTVTGHVKVFWSPAATIQEWRGVSSTLDGFELINPNIPANVSITPGNYEIFKIQWSDMIGKVGPTSHTCFLARFESDPLTADPVNNEDISGAWSTCASTIGSNNIAWKNVTFVNDYGRSPGVLVGNPTSTPITACLAFQVTNNGTNGSIIENGGVSVDLGPDLYARWAAGGKQGTGIMDSPKCHLAVAGICLHSHILENGQPVVNNPYEVKIISTDARLENLIYPTKQMDEVRLNFTFASSGNDKDGIYTYDLIQSAARNNIQCDVVGGERYIIQRPLCPLPKAGDDVTIGRGCSTFLSASPIMSGARYNWYNARTGVLVDTGSTIKVSPLNSIVYELEMITSSGCIDYDSVRVNVNTTSMCPIKNYALECPAPSVSEKVLSGILTSPLRMANDTAWISGTLIVPSYVTLTLDNMLVYMKGADPRGIQVQPGGKLVINGSVLGSCSDETWSGIDVTGTNTDGNQLSIYETQILNAVNPIKMRDVIGSEIVDNIMVGGSTAITLIHNKDFLIEGNLLQNYGIGISTQQTLPNTGSAIKQNNIVDINIGINMSGDTHATLDITCNVFDDYTQYAMKAISSILKSQGSLLQGAGNTFVNSTSTLVNSKLLYNGPAMTYYYDPSAPLSLTTGLGMTAVALPAQANASCSPIAARIGADNTAIETGSDQISALTSNTPTPTREFKLYPNPSNGTFNFDYSLMSNENGSVMIFDISGKVVASYKLINDQNHLLMENNHLADGVYYYRVVINNAPVLTKKLVIIR